MTGFITINPENNEINKTSCDLYEKDGKDLSNKINLIF